jgi:hypothetical protein
MTLNKKNITYIILLVIISVSGIVLRYHQITTKAFEYDEIWTITNYASKTNSVIFTDLAPPNNHPVNSLIIKYLVQLFGVNQLVVRISPLLCGIALLAAVGWLTWSLFKNRFAVVTAVLLCTFNGGLIHYSQTGRGYMLQTFMLTTMLLAIILYEKYRHTTKPASKAILLIVIPFSAITAILTLSPSILFITAFVAIHCFYLLDKYILKNGSIEFKHNIIQAVKENISLIICYALLYIFAIIWYVSNLSKFSAGQQFGTQITSITVFIDYIKQFFPKLSGYLLPFIPLLMLFNKLFRKWAIAYLFIVCVLFVSIFIFRGGPPRSYLPIIPIIAIAAAGTAGMIQQRFKTVNLKNIIIMSFVGLSISICSFYLLSTLSAWQPSDWRKIWVAAQKSFPEKNSFISYPACAGLEVNFNNRPMAAINNCQRMIQPGKFVQIAQPGAISVTDRKGSQTEIKVSNIEPLTKDIAGVKAEIYKIKKLLSGSKRSGLIIAYIPPNSPKKAKAAYGFLMYESGKDWYTVNTWLSRTTMYNINKQPFRYFILASDDWRLSTQELLSIETRSRGVVRFFYLAAYDKP